MKRRQKEQKGEGDAVIMELKFSRVIGLNSTAINADASESDLDALMTVWRKSRKATSQAISPKPENPPGPEVSPSPQAVNSVLLCSERTWDDRVLEACSQLGFLRQNQHTLGSVDPTVEAARQAVRFLAFFIDSV